MKEEATAKPKVGFFPTNAHPYSWQSLICTWFIWALNSFDYQLVFATAPLAIAEFGISASTWGTLLCVWMLVRVVVDMPLSSLSDKVGSGWRRKLLWAPIVLSYALIGFLNTFRGLSNTIIKYFVLRTGVTIGASACEVLGVAASSEWWPKQHRGFAVGLHHTGFPIGSLIAGLVAAFVINTFGEGNWRYVFAFSLLSIPFVIWYWRLATPKKMEDVYKHIDETGLSRPHSEEVSVEAKGPWTEILKKYEIVSAGIYVALFMGVYILFQSTFPAYLSFTQGYSFAAVAALSFVWPITGALFQVLLPAWSDKIGRKWLLVGAGFYAGIIMLFLPYATTAVGVIAVQVFYGVVLNAVYPICFSVAADSAPEGRVATSISFTTAALWLGAALASLLGGWLVSLGGGWDSITGYKWVFYVMSALSILAGVVHLFAKETAGAKAE